MIKIMFRESDGSVAMRRLLLAAAVLGTATCAQAADMPDYLRGGYGPVTTNWRGFYIGGQGGYGSTDANFGGSTVNEILLEGLISNSVLRQIGLTAPFASGKSSAQNAGYGAFTGYNWQWDDVVAGIEMSYLHGNFGGSVTAIKSFASAGALTDGNFHAGTVTSTSAIGITDYATFRGRAAWAYNCFLPYAFGGLALGNANFTNTVKIQDSVSAVAIGPFTQVLPVSATDLTHNHLVYGYTAGLGIDINLVAGLFVRAEWEYVRFATTIDTNINTVRLGLAYRF
jgi:outer membrane immunogenic protein